MKFENELGIALKAAKTAGKIQLKFFKKFLIVHIKKDKSPVTQVDKKSEAAIIKIIKKKFPHDGFFGEETGEKASASGRRWIIDPLDGTRPYIYGLPFFSVLIALEENNKVVLGIIHLPALKETYYAVKGKGAFCNKKRIYVSKTKSLLKAHGAILGWNEMKDHRALSLLKLGSKVNYIFGFNDAYTYGCVACGKMDFSVNILDKAWDNASISIIIKEAGGEFSDLHGKASIYSNSTVVSNGLIHDELIQALH